MKAHGNSRLLKSYKLPKISRVFLKTEPPPTHTQCQILIQIEVQMNEKKISDGFFVPIRRNVE